MTQAPARPRPSADGAPDAPGPVEATAPEGPTVGPSSGRRPAHGGRTRRGPWLVALGLYVAAVAAVLMWPTPVDDGARDDIGTTLATLHAMGLPGWVDYDVVESAANVAMFVPLGFMVARVAGPWWGVVAPAAFSAAAELGQYLLRPDRTPTWADVAANTTGAALGVVAAVLLMGRGRPASRASGRRPARSPRRPGSSPR